MNWFQFGPPFELQWMNKKTKKCSVKKKYNHALYDLQRVVNMKDMPSTNEECGIIKNKYYIDVNTTNKEFSSFIHVVAYICEKMICIRKKGIQVGIYINHRQKYDCTEGSQVSIATCFIPCNETSNIHSILKKCIQNGKKSSYKCSLYDLLKRFNCNLSFNCWRSIENFQGDAPNLCLYNETSFKLSDHHFLKNCYVCLSNDGVGWYVQDFNYNIKEYYYIYVYYFIVFIIIIFIIVKLFFLKSYFHNNK